VAVEHASWKGKEKQMIINEIITKSPSRYGGGAPSMSAQRMTAPNTTTPRGFSDPIFVKRAKQQKYNREKQFKALTTAKEKFDFLYGLEKGKSTNQIRIQGPSNLTYHIQQYNPVTGDIVLLLKGLQSDDTIKGNTSNFVYQGRQASGATGPKIYIFIPQDLTTISSEPKIKKTNRGRPTGSVKKQYKFPPNPW
jgi:hypothetical protein